MMSQTVQYAYSSRADARSAGGLGFDLSYFSASLCLFRLFSYIVLSASFIISSGLFSSVNSQSPTLMEISIFAPSAFSAAVLSKLEILSTILLAIVPVVLGKTTTNSSPPYLPNKSPCRMVSLTTEANIFSAESPASWPYKSLICLNLSISIMATDNLPATRLADSNSYRYRLIRYCRLNTPVSPSF